MKSVLISIKPQWVTEIKIGEKTIEVRKTRPAIETPFKCYIYETKEKFKARLFTRDVFCQGKGKVIGEFVCHKIDEYLCEKYDWSDGEDSLEYRIPSVEGRKTCLEYDEIREYGKGKPLYFWHISDLVIYDKPKELSEFESACHCFNIKNVECKTNAFGEYVFQHYDNSFCRICKYYNSDFGDCDKPAFQPLKRPPQSWCYVE